VVGNGDADDRRQHLLRRGGEAGIRLIQPSRFGAGHGLALFGTAALALVAVLPAALALLPVSDAWGDALGLVRWPILAGIVILALAIVYRYAPDRAEPKWQWISWGSIAATTLWILGSIAFTTYVSKVGSYDKTYGSLGGVIILLLWFYLTAYVILLGTELNAEIERQTTHGAACSLDRRDSGGYAGTRREF
jgi:membrane protein